MSFKKLSLRSQLLLVVVCIVLAGFVLTLAVLTNRAANLQQTTALKQVEELADKYSKQASVPLRTALDTARAMSHAMAAMQQTSHADRELANQMMRRCCKTTPAISRCGPFGNLMRLTGVMPNTRAHQGMTTRVAM